MSVRADAETLRSLPLFANCDPLHLQLLAFSSGRQQFAAGEVLIGQGQKAHACYLILSGEAQLHLNGTDGGQDIGTAGPGAFLGEVAMLAGVPYSVTARAMSPVAAAIITRKLFMRVAEEYPEFGKAVFRALGGKLGQSMTELAATRVHFDKASPFSRL